MDFKTILVERRDSVGLITFNRPDALNALSTEVIGELGQALLYVALRTNEVEPVQ